MKLFFGYTSEPGDLMTYNGIQMFLSLYFQSKFSYEPNCLLLLAGFYHLISLLHA